MTIISGEHVLSLVTHDVALEACVTEQFYIISVAWDFSSVAYD